MVTGASGFVGEHLVRQLTATPATVTGVYRSREVSIQRAQMVCADLSQASDVARLIKTVEPDVVFHCAAATNVASCQQHPDEARRDIVDATSFLADNVARMRPDAVMVGLSTDLVFDGERAPYRETSPTGPLSTYGQLKLEAEAPILALSRGVVLRTSLVYGAPMTYKASFIRWMVDQFQNHQILPLFADEVRTPIYVDDLCEAMMQIAELQESGLWHVGGPHRLDRVAMGRAVCRAYGFDQGLIRPESLANSTYSAPRPKDVSLDCAKISSRLAMNPRSFDTGVREIANANNHPY